MVGKMGYLDEIKTKNGLRRLMAFFVRPLVLMCENVFQRMP